MADNLISPLAYIHPTAKLGQNVKVQAFAYIDKDVVIGDNTFVMAHATILEGAVIGNDNYIYQNAVIGATPQSFRYKQGHLTHVHIGNNNRIRENVVIAGSLSEDTATTIGNDNFLMDGVHICHDVVIGNNCVIGIYAQIAGDCILDDHVVLSSAAILQHRVHVGRFSLLQSGCRVQKDVPPYIILGGNPATYHGVNSLVLEKEGETERILRHIANTYRLIYTGGFSLQDAVIKIKEQIPTSVEIENIVNFIKNSKRGIVRRLKEEN